MAILRLAKDSITDSVTFIFEVELESWIFERLFQIQRLKAP